MRSRPFYRFVALLLIFLLGWGGVSWPAEALTETAMAQTSAPGQSIQPYLDRVIQRVTEFRLENGMKFIVLERHEAPVVSFLTYADVGGVDEPDGKTGVAHFLEHMAFKGTSQIGTVNHAREKELLNQLDALAEQIKTAQKKGQTATVEKLTAQFTQLETEAMALVRQNEFGRIVEQAGGVGLNANTSAEATRYFYSFPSNKLELWMSLESERFLDPVFREFFKEQQVILEERRLRTDNSPIGQLIEAYLDKAFQVHPYRRPVIGYDEDIRNLTRQDIQDFFDSHYIPSKLTVAIVGDADPQEVQRLAQIYFGRYRARPAPKENIPIEPPQAAPQEVTLTLRSQPWYLEGYHRPAVTHPDNVVYDMIASILSDGRTSRLYKSLVEEQKVALTAQGFTGFPGNKYPNLILFYGLTAPGRSVEELGKALNAEIERLKTEPVSTQELERVKNQARASLLQSLKSNMGMAQALLEYEIKTGSWRNLFKEIEQIEAVTAADIQRVAKATFVPSNRTIGRLLPQE